MAKKRDFGQVGHKYSKQRANEFYELCLQGLDLAQCAHQMQVTEEVIMKWAKDDRKKEFGRAYDAGKTACEAYHSKLLDDMILGKATQAALQTQFKRLQTLFPDRWNVATKSEVKIEDPYAEMTDKELDLRLSSLIKKRQEAGIRLEVVDKPREDVKGREDKGS